VGLSPREGHPDRMREAGNALTPAARGGGAKWPTDSWTLLTTAAFVAVLGGTFSLERLGIGGGLMVDWRVWSIPLVLAGVGHRLLTRPEARPPPSWRAGSARWFVTLVTFHLYFSLSAAWSPDPRSAAEMSLFLILELALLCCAMLLARERPLASVGLYILLFFVAGVVFITGALMRVGQVDPQGRMAPFWGDPNVFVRLMAIAGAAAICLWAKRAERRWLLAVPLFAMGALLSGSRGGLLALLLAGSPLLLMFRSAGFKRIALALGGLFVVAGLFATPWVRTHVTDLVFERYWQLTIVERYATGRKPIFLAAIGRFLEDPLVGGGLQSFFQTVGHSRGWLYAHNIFLEAAAEGGVVGLILLCALLMPLLRRMAPGDPPEWLFLIFGARFFFFASLVSGNYYDNRYLWLFLGLLILTESEVSRSATQPPEGVDGSDLADDASLTMSGATGRSDRGEPVR
jgi:O-antigen ligase